MTNYEKFRGKCKEMSAALVAADGALRLVRGYYYCPVWGEQAHWWCVTAAGIVVDPTALQFPSEGRGVYVEFDGLVTCSECGNRVPEEAAIFASNYAFCSNACYGRFVGVYP